VSTPSSRGRGIYLALDSPVRKSPTDLSVQWALAFWSTSLEACISALPLASLIPSTEEVIVLFLLASVRCKLIHRIIVLFVCFGTIAMSAPVGCAWAMFSQTKAQSVQRKNKNHACMKEEQKNVRRAGRLSGYYVGRAAAGCCELPLRVYWLLCMVWVIYNRPPHGRW
jgi:hypothetical protein